MNFYRCGMWKVLINMLNSWNFLKEVILLFEIEGTVWSFLFEVFVRCCKLAVVGNWRKHIVVISREVFTFDSDNSAIALASACLLLENFLALVAEHFNSAQKFSLELALTYISAPTGMFRFVRSISIIFL